MFSHLLTHNYVPASKGHKILWSFSQNGALGKRLRYLQVNGKCKIKFLPFRIENQMFSLEYMIIHLLDFKRKYLVNCILLTNMYFRFSLKRKVMLLLVVHGCSTELTLLNNLCFMWVLIKITLNTWHKIIKASWRVHYR